MNECPDVTEVMRAVNTLSDRKSPGVDDIHPELLKKGDAELILRLTELITESWKNEEVPQDWKDAQLVTIFKKGDRRICEITVASYYSLSQGKYLPVYYSIDSRNT